MKIGQTGQHHFNPRPPRGGRQDDTVEIIAVVMISIHAPREGGDVTMKRAIADWSKFQSTPPARGATRLVESLIRCGFISIHAPREGGDANIIAPKPIKKISIHAPREGGDFRPVHLHRFVQRFQSTPPARGATSSTPYSFALRLFQSTPPARGATAKMHSFTCGSLTNK